MFFLQKTRERLHISKKNSNFAPEIEYNKQTFIQ